MYLKIAEYDNGKPILFGSNAMRTPFSVAVKGVDISDSANNRKLIPEGAFIVDIGGTVRFLPRTRLHAASATNSAVLTLKAPHFAFKVGDVVRAVAGYAHVDVTGTPTTGAVLTLRIDNVNYSVTTTASETTLASIATLLAGLTIPNVTLTASGSRVTVIARDSYSISAYSSNPAVGLDVVSTEPGYFGECVMPLGTVLSIGAVDGNGNRPITLAGNAAYVLPANTPVGVTVNKFLGIFPEQLDLTDNPVQHIAPFFHADGVYENNLPYVDNQIKRQLHGLNICKKFYAAA